MKPIPTDPDNFIIEVTPKVLDELRDIYRYSDEDPVVDMLHSPHWGKINQ